MIGVEIGVLQAEQLWSPAISNWFPGMTPPMMRTVTARQILDMYRFISTNSQDA